MAKAAAARIYRVTQLVPIWGDVLRDATEIDEATAVTIRQAEGDVVVCGADLQENATVAERIEKTAHGAYKHEAPHRNAGLHALPHYQPLTRPPMGHTFYETVRKKAKKDESMKFFTPELYERFATSSARGAVQAHAAWEAAERAYEERLAAIRKRLSPAARQLADGFCLKDAVLLNMPNSETEAVLWLRQGNVLYALHYRLKAALEITKVGVSEVWQENEPRWLYDEVDLTEKGWLSHEILFSQGYVLRILFDDFQSSIQEVHPIGTSQRLQTLLRFVPIADELPKKKVAKQPRDKSSSVDISIPAGRVRELKEIAQEAKSEPAAVDLFSRSGAAGFLVWPRHAKQAKRKVTDAGRKSSKGAGGRPPSKGPRK